MSSLLAAVAFGATAPMKTFTRAALVLSLGSSLALAQGAGTITGRVSNAATGAYLGNAEVRIVGTDRVTTTTDNGRYTFVGVPAGETKISVSYTGLDTAEQSVSVPAGGAATADFNLTTAAYADVVQLGQFVVAGEREGNARAIVDQKQAANIKTVIAADAFGDVAEGNIGEFLKLLPGLSVDYVENDVRLVRVRGLSPKYSSVTLDGNPIASSASSSIDTGRQFEFEQVSLATLETVEINKSPLADQPASSLSGTVNVKSKSALNQKGRRIRYNANVTVNEYARTIKKTRGWDNKEHYKALPGGSLEFSDTFMEDRLGVVAAVNHSGSYVEQKILIGGYTFDRNPNNNQTEVPGFNNWNFQDGLKPTWRDSVMLNLDYRLNPDAILSLRTSYNYYNAPFHNRNWVVNANTSGSTVNADGTLNFPGLTNLTKSSARSMAPAANNTNSTAQVQGSNLRKYGATFLISPELSWNINENLRFNGGLSYSRSYNWYDSGAEGFFSQVTARMNGVSWEYSRPEASAVTIRQLTSGTSNNASFLDLANYNAAVTVNREERNSKDQFWTGRGDLTVKLPNAPVPTVLKMGVDARLQVRDIQNFNPQWAVNTGTGGINLGNFRDPYTPRPNKGETIIDAAGNIGAPPSPDKWRLFELFNNYNTDPFAPTTTAQQPFNANVAANMRNFLQTQFDIEEQINSAYLMGTIQPTRTLQFVAGLRFESTEVKGRSFDDIGHAAAGAAAGTTNTNDTRYIAARYGNRRWRESNYDDFFPSAQVRYSPTQNLVVRGAYYRSILRPDFASVVGGISVNDTNTSFTIRNNDLDPERAHNFDARVEYYFEPVGVISAGVFYKELSDIQVSVAQIYDRFNLPEFLTELGYSDANVPSDPTVTSVLNAGKSSIWGFELEYSQQLSFLPGALNGLGVFANYTYTKPKNKQLFSLTAEDGIPPHVFNTGISYRLKRFNGQVKLNWVDDRLRQVTGVTVSPNGTITPNTGGNNSNRHEYTYERLIIDLNLNYEFSRRATVFLNISNLTDEPQIRYFENISNWGRDGAFGSKFTLGVKGSF